ncbi:MULTISPECIES: conserved phage C-terminal domain-containing protein [Elizabethkingia]|uniref:Phage conserved hypothetical protein C-terminal domain-containing protein n=1 Tax=Elizabethkingia occulta TaxID=1867263 RepID=A0A1T3MAC6_9FLAO|nr:MULTISPECIES: conserved phage C-terminal domain-containing protein [Elizabethkingia]MDE5439373.1 conserved phage C-terminal domain-containing protein [Elizabethkingia meningoseptica]MDE5516535.1 conserved phage C-terminal domain-containing protein [Elizabethkingia meningoseptica]MDN4033607.1 conserved phage C-terminal domain-containing protein [Elizabethkingia meningoseptica]OPC61585.1 hypothetical protein BAZ10_10800 [Elizabethkingia occulta]
METETITSEIEILNYFNEITGKRFKAIKSNISPISARFKAGYTKEQMQEVIQLKTIEWKNNEVMAQHLCPTTIFRPSNFDKYVNQVETVKANPQQYKKYYEELNKPKHNDPASAFSKIDAMFGGKQ